MCLVREIISMGNPVSKVGQEICEEEPTEGSLPSTPILTPKAKIIDLDPRSPSTNVIRTPIEVLFSADKSFSSDSLNNKYDKDTFNINSPSPRTLDVDPRSPTTDFIRTPIVTSECNSKNSLPSKLHNKNLDNVRKTLMMYTPTTTIRTAKVRGRIPPKLLKSSPIVAKPSDNKRKSFVGLLETNLDYVETDLDMVRQNSTPIKQIENATESFEHSGKSENISSVKSPMYICEIDDPRSPTVDFVRTPLQVLKKKSEINFDEEKLSTKTMNEDAVDKHSMITADVCKYEDVESHSSSTDSVQTGDANSINNNDIGLIFEDVSNIKQSNKVKDFNDDGLKLQECIEPITPQLTKQPNKDVEKPSDVESSVTIENIRDLDKKLTNLIYEDKSAEMIVRNKANKESRSRMPLGAYNSNGNPKKSIPKLKVSDQPRKNERDLSKIPILKERKSKGKLTQQCENTPPKNIEELRNNKSKKSHWDPDNTLII